MHPVLTPTPAFGRSHYERWSAAAGRYEGGRMAVPGARRSRTGPKKPGPHRPNRLPTMPSTQVVPTGLQDGPLTLPERQNVPCPIKKASRTGMDSEVLTRTRSGRGLPSGGCEISRDWRSDPRSSITCGPWARAHCKFATSGPLADRSVGGASLQPEQVWDFGGHRTLATVAFVRNANWSKS